MRDRTIGLHIEKESKDIQDQSLDKFDGDIQKQMEVTT
jgi:hypothetical protein